MMILLLAVLGPAAQANLKLVPNRVSIESMSELQKDEKITFPQGFTLESRSPDGRTLFREYVISEYGAFCRFAMISGLSEKIEINENRTWTLVGDAHRHLLVLGGRDTFQLREPVSGRTMDVSCNRKMSPAMLENRGFDLPTQRETKPTLVETIRYDSVEVGSAGGTSGI